MAYLRSQAGRIVHTDELLIVAGIGDYARRIRELRTQCGWPIISGMAVQDMRNEMIRNGMLGAGVPTSMAPEEYMLVEDRQDIDAVRRWSMASSVRDAQGSTKERLLTYLRGSIGQRITAEELRYASGNDNDWAQTIRELRNAGWPIESYAFGSSDLPMGIFVLRGEGELGTGPH
ncbi:hypothetical protein [Sphingosinicella sp. LY1275]|uniref:hypothetical protein n=1 Tax=Sphingosinicella sp. LY1275 TaxID=3095379 RepID=UPI002ADEC9D1|nr:hypothetical protein [Sphingosinicella sp. LY1275]MEA1015143.1 hypothetical protein [Sphingosinicella sp. LY1275]